MFKNPRYSTFLSVILLSITIISTFIGSFPTYAAEGQGNAIRVGWYESAFNYKDKAGNRAGYAYEYQQKIAAYTGWKYEYVAGGWTNLLDQLIAGDIDIMTDVSKTPEREREMLFSDMPMGTEEYYLLVERRQ